MPTPYHSCVQDEDAANAAQRHQQVVDTKAYIAHFLEERMHQKAAKRAADVAEDKKIQVRVQRGMMGWDRLLKTVQGAKTSVRDRFHMRANAGQGWEDRMAAFEPPPQLCLPDQAPLCVSTTFSTPRLTMFSCVFPTGLLGLCALRLSAPSHFCSGCAPVCVYHRATGPQCVRVRLKRPPVLQRTRRWQTACMSRCVELILHSGAVCKAVLLVSCAWYVPDRVCACSVFLNRIVTCVFPSFRRTGVRMFGPPELQHHFYFLVIYPPVFVPSQVKKEMEGAKRAREEEEELINMLQQVGWGKAGSAGGCMELHGTSRLALRLGQTSLGSKREHGALWRHGDWIRDQ